MKKKERIVGVKLFEIDRYIRAKCYYKCSKINNVRSLPNTSCKGAILANLFRDIKHFIGYEEKIYISIILFIL